MAGLTQDSFPTASEPIATFGTNNVKVNVTPVWYKFFNTLSVLIANVVAGSLGFTITPNVTATGTTQATARGLTTEWSVVTTVAPNTGVRLREVGAGVPFTIFNRGANSLKVYPPIGLQIDGLGMNNSYLLPAGKVQIFNQISNTTYLSTQLG